MELLPGGSIALPTLPPATSTYVLARARGEATTLTSDRSRVMAASAAVIERLAGALIWTPSGGRSVVTVVRLSRRERLSDVPARPLALITGPPTVERLEDSTETWSIVPASEWRPRITVGCGTYRITGTVAALAEVPPAADEALARLWAWEDVQRPADKDLLDTRPTAATGALRKSGAGLMIRQVADALGGVMVPM